MANKPVSGLESSVGIADPDLFLLSEITNSTKSSKKISWSTLKNYIKGLFTIPSASDILKEAYPIGSLYITLNSSVPFGFGTWQKVGQGHCLWSAKDGQPLGDTIKAGLPNIVGKITNSKSDTERLTYGDEFSVTSNSALQLGAHRNTNAYIKPTGEGGGWDEISFNASLSNPIYGRSDTVQPPAYLINVFRRMS